MSNPIIEIETTNNVKHNFKCKIIKIKLKINIILNIAAFNFDMGRQQRDLMKDHY
jgi:hypothetical protein